MVKLKYCTNIVKQKQEIILQFLDKFLLTIEVIFIFLNICFFYGEENDAQF